MWIPIDELDKYFDEKSNKMFVVKAIDIMIDGRYKYTSDPYCVWRANGEFVRWPHPFNPTHFCVLPE